MNRIVSPWCALFCATFAGPTMASGALTTLYEFKGTPDAANPAANIAVDASGDIFGGTQGGGRHGEGAIFELSPPTGGQTKWSETRIGHFPGTRAGTGLYGGVIRNKHGNLYGVALDGGANGCGSVFEIRDSKLGFKQSTHWVFQGGKTDGCLPSAALTMDDGGALYGNTFYGGANNDGVVFKVAPPVSGAGPWTETVIRSFDGSVDGSPSDQMTFDDVGNMYGTAYEGGSGGEGVVWELTPPVQGSTTWTRTVLWSFSGLDGAEPTRGPLVMLPSGVLVGTCHSGGEYGHGVVYQLKPPAQGQKNWRESTIWAFEGGALGGDPTSGVARASHGELIVPTDDSNGAIIELLPPTEQGASWTEKTLWQFSGGDGSEPEMPPLLRSNHVIEGTTNSGGLGYGTVWRLEW
jgi:uncharacterized repeat protein (TIGR03803 family)